LVLRVVNRFPGVVYLGAGVLVWTAVKMITSEPLLKPWFAATPVIGWLIFMAIPLVLWAGFVRNHRRFESRIHARLAHFAAQRPPGASSAPARARVFQPQGGKTMLKVLVPVDGSANALHAVRHTIAEYQRHHELELHLLNVQPRLYRHIARFVSRRDRQAWQHDRADAALAAARALLTQAGVPHALDHRRPR
jgi:hypothetical protein